MESIKKFIIRHYFSDYIGKLNGKYRSVKRVSYPIGLSFILLGFAEVLELNYLTPYLLGVLVINISLIIPTYFIKNKWDYMDLQQKYLYGINLSLSEEEQDDWGTIYIWYKTKLECNNYNILQITGSMLMVVIAITVLIIITLNK